MLLNFDKLSVTLFRVFCASVIATLSSSRVVEVIATHARAQAAAPAATAAPMSEATKGKLDKYWTK